MMPICKRLACAEAEECSRSGEMIRGGGGGDCRRSRGHLANRKGCRGLEVTQIEWPAAACSSDGDDGCSGSRGGSRF